MTINEHVKKTSVPQSLKLSPIFQTSIAQNLIEALYDHSGTLIDNSGEIKDIPGIYTPFRSNTNSSPFANEVRITFSNGKRSANISLFHEAIHGLQWGSMPILHASPYNPQTNLPTFVLCPDDWLRMVLLTEQGAYAKQAWLTHEAAKEDTDFIPNDSFSPASAQDFNRFYAETGNDLMEALVKSGNLALTKMIATNPGAKPSTFGEHYIHNALQTYEESFRLKSPKDIIFVRMEGKDITNTSSAIGPRIIGSGRLSAWWNINAFITPALSERLKSLNENLGITNKNTLPTLSEALIRNASLTPESFMEISKGQLTFASVA